MIELTINVNPTSDMTMYEQIYEYIKNDIKSGNLEPGDKLPSTRSLAKHIDVSRSTTQMAYDQLMSEGYIKSIPCKGYFVCQIDGMYDIPVTSQVVSTPVCETTDYIICDFSPRGIALENFPFSSWRKVSKNILINDNKELFNSGNAKGELILRSAICDYLHQSRGVICSPEQVIIGAGNDYLLMLLHQLLSPVSIIAMENPTYIQAYKTLKILGRTILPVSMDKDGMNINDLRKCGADIAYVMPSHQFPTGIVMPVKRRQELLKWANEKENRYIIEDDYDSEFRYKGKPIPSLQANAGTSNHVIYLGTFSKAIAPAIRMSYVVLPSGLLEIYEKNFSFLSNTVSRIDQTVVNEFIRKGHYERHLNKLRALYKNRHDALLNALKPFEKNFIISGEYSGIHILLTSKNGTSAKKLADDAKKMGVRVYPIENHCMEGTKVDSWQKSTLLIGYANIATSQISEGIELLKKAWNI